MEAVVVADVHHPVCAPSPETRSAGRALLVVGTLGVGVSLLTWRVGDAGAGWLVTDALLVAGVLAGFGRSRPRASQWILAAASLWLAGATTWYASDWVLATALPASLVTLAMLALVTARRTPASALSNLGRDAVDALRAVPRGVADAARTPVQVVRGGRRGHFVGVLRGAAVGVPLAGIFALLLSADWQFRHTLTGMVRRSGEGVELALWTVATTAGLLVAYAVLARLQRPRVPEAPGVVPWVAVPYRAEGDAAAPVAPSAGGQSGVLTWGVVLGHVIAVFGVYIVANAGTLFAGHAHLRARGTVTYAQYLQEGFAEVSVATLLAVACVVFGHVLLGPRDGRTRVHGGKVLVAMELALLSLVAVTLASCAHRLALYEEAYGYTYLRLGVWLLQLGAAGLLAMTAARCLARGWGGWGTALVWSGVAFMVLAGSINADAWIARANVARARAGAPLDVGYLAGLSEDARGVLDEVNKLDPDAAASLDDAWTTSSTAHHARGWRSLRGVGAPSYDARELR